MFLYLIPLILIIAADQITKVLTVKSFAVGEGFTLIPNFIDITFVRNEGAAFGIFQGRKWLLIAVSVLVFAAIVFYVVRYKPRSKWLLWSLTLIVAGGLGNLIDRAALGYVRDMIELTFMRFPVFNIADSAITVGAIMLALRVLIRGVKDEADFDFDGDTGCPQ